MKAENMAGGAVVVCFLGFIALAVGGWVFNIAKFFWSLDDPLTAMIVARGIGIFIPPIGAILGFL